ncbi:hypothetical protein GCM10007049_21360 [Echinicola pacifica]|uniref:Uncharacterized protein n=1 Tax=Echinicola pacifica TaxID=346377 RepID=A0A918UQG0_9BACT|nr:hypothetical protein GCM10007049_21360 [Echinicola pacifica]
MRFLTLSSFMNWDTRYFINQPNRYIKKYRKSFDDGENFLILSNAFPLISFNGFVGRFYRDR